MRKIPAMTDMRMSPDEAKKAMPWRSDDDGDMPSYPCGLCISLSEAELDKLGLTDDVEVGDLIHLHCMAKVTSVSKTDTEAGGPCCRVELQITNMVGLNEEEENQEMDATPAATRRSRMYG